MIPHVSLVSDFTRFAWEKLQALELISPCADTFLHHIVIIAFRYDKTVSLSNTTNKAHLKCVTSHVLHDVAAIQGLLTLGRL